MCLCVLWIACVFLCATSDMYLCRTLYTCNQTSVTVSAGNNEQLTILGKKKNTGRIEK